MIRVGTRAYLRDERRNGDVIEIPVSVLDHRVIFGRDEYEVTPYGGRGTTWVTETNLKEKLT